jgi:hypothetical protein
MLNVGNVAFGKHVAYKNKLVMCCGLFCVVLGLNHEILCGEGRKDTGYDTGLSCTG